MSCIFPIRLLPCNAMLLPTASPISQHESEGGNRAPNKAPHSEHSPGVVPRLTSISSPGPSCPRLTPLHLPASMLTWLTPGGPLKPCPFYWHIRWGRRHKTDNKSQIFKPSYWEKKVRFRLCPQKNVITRQNRDGNLTVFR